MKRHRSTTRKILTMLVTASLMGALASCAGPNQTTSDVSNEQTTQAAEATDESGAPLEEEASDASGAYDWLRTDDGSLLSGDQAVARNLELQTAHNQEIADWCLEEAAKLPEDSDIRKEFEHYAGELRDYTFAIPSEAERQTYTEGFLSNISSQLQEEAVDYYRHCVEAEPAISADLIEVSNATGTMLYGFEHRLKSAGENEYGTCRIADKIASIMKTAEDAGAPITYREAVEQIEDFVRYTQLGTPDTMVWNYLTTREMLEAKGYTFTAVINTWQTYTTNLPYRGVNTKVVSPDGVLFELQFHTTESFVTKSVEHANYEIRRNPKTSSEERLRLSAESYSLYDRMSEPKGVEEIK